jgi:CheY-like chemotaxis protein
MKLEKSASDGNPEPFSKHSLPKREAGAASAQGLALQEERSSMSEEGADVGPENFAFRFSPLASAIVEISKNDRATVKDVAEVIDADPLFRSRLLAVANYSSGLMHKFSTVAQAINAFGVDHLKSLALGLSLFEMESTPPSGGPGQPAQHGVTLRQLWEHSLGCAAVAGRIAAKINHPFPHLVFVAGFVHDLGRVLFYRNWPARYLEAWSVATDKSIPEIEAEALGLGMSHADFGALWASRADLPSCLQQTIRHHHKPFGMLTDVLDAETATIIAIVQLADAEWNRNPIGREGAPGEEVDDLWKRFNLRAEVWADHRAAIKQEVDASRDLFGFDREDVERPNDRAGGGGRTHPSSQRERAIADAPQRNRIIQFPALPESPQPRIGTSVESREPNQKLTVLIVEDHGSLCEMLRLCFMRVGYHVRTANDGKDALDILARETVHLVLLDLMLPRVDGFTVLKQMRETSCSKRPYVIVVSAGASEKDRNKVLELGADEYMPKPFHLMRLLERVQTVEHYLF